MRPGRAGHQSSPELDATGAADVRRGCWARRNPAYRHRVHPDPASTHDLSGAVERVLDALERFLEFDGPDPARHRSSWLAALNRPLPQIGVGRDAALGELTDAVIANGLRIGHPGFTGWVTTMPTDVGAAADLAQTVGVPQRWWATPGNLVDHLAVRWLIELLGFPATYAGTLPSGGSTSNLVGIGAARQHAGERLGLDASLDGISGFSNPKVYASETTHHVVGRALGVLGMGRANLRAIPLDARGTMDTGRLVQALDQDEADGCTQVAIVGSAGDANMGLIDPLPELAVIAHERSIWFHVDGAYGGFGLLDPRIRDRYGDVSEYDSFAVDPHKWMAAPIGTGAVFVRDESLLTRAFTVETGSYDSERSVERGMGDLGSPFDELGYGTPDWGVEFSTPARGVAVWAILNEIGADGMRRRVIRHNDCARRVAERAKESPELELLAEPTLSICCFRYRPPGMGAEEADSLNERLLHELRAGGSYVTSSTTVEGAFALRPCFINPRSTVTEADGLVDEVLAIGRRLHAPSN